MRRITFSEGEYYHLYNRGVDKRTVFADHSDYERFLAYLFLFNDSERTRIDYQLSRGSVDWEAKPSRPLVAIGAYCLMPNHFHLYATPLVEQGISKFMQRLQTGYTMYFNQKHERSGALFQGTFKAQHANSDRYAKFLFSYIHLNPAKLKDPHWKERGARDLKELRDYVRKYPYSSMGEYLTGKSAISNPAKFPAYLWRKKDIDDHIDSWIATRNLEG